MGTAQSVECPLYVPAPSLGFPGHQCPLDPPELGRGGGGGLTKLVFQETAEIPILLFLIC